MAGDWIKLEMTTPDKPEVVMIAGLLGIDQDAVTGKLFRIWIWADLNSVNGNDVSVTDSFIDRITFQPGFASAMREAGWLLGDSGCVTFPNFGRHNGKTAKNRGLTNRRVAELRASRNANDNDNVTLKALPIPLPEKRREESITPKPPRGRGSRFNSLSFFESLCTEGPPEWSILGSGKFRKAYREWLEHRQQKRKPITSLAMKKQLNRCEGWGVERSAVNIAVSIERGWEGIYEPGSRNTGGEARPVWEKGEMIELSN